MLNVATIALACCTISGRVTNEGGTPVAHASVRLPTLSRPSARSASGDVEGDATGRFRINVPAGSYRMVVRAPGFASALLDDIVVLGGETIDVALQALGSGRLRTIAEASVDGRPRVASATIPSRTISRSELDAFGRETIADALEGIPSATSARPSGAVTGPVVVALRGPDPSETRIALDGQVLNDANTGDVDLARFPVALSSAVDVSEGLGPSDAGGANTIGGEIDVRTLQPSERSQALLRLTAGSFGGSATELNATGTSDKLGYAFGLSRTNRQGYVHDFRADVNGVETTLGAAVRSSAALLKLSYEPAPGYRLGVRSFTLDNVRDVSAAINAPQVGASDAAGSVFSGIGAETRAQSIRATLAAGSAPLGGGTLAASYADSSSTVAILQTRAGGPYDVSHVDRIGTTSLEWSKSHGPTDIAIGSYVRGETLAAPDQFSSEQSDQSAAVTLRAGFDVSPRFHVGASAIDSTYSTFGSSLDARLGLRYATSLGGALRFAVGKGFRAPLLTERFTLPLARLTPDGNCVGTNGNAALRPEHATEYELGYGRRIGNATTTDLVLYQTDLRDPIENFYPLGATCPAGTSAPIAQTYPVNAGNVVYRGGALSVVHRSGPLSTRIEYAINAAFPTSLPAYVNNPTSGGNLVVGQQFERIPLQKLAAGLRYARGGTHAAAELTVRSANNELSQGRYGILDAAIGRSFGRHFDFTLAGRNLTSAVSGRFVRLGGGVPYPTPRGLRPTNALVLEPASVNAVLSIH